MRGIWRPICLEPRAHLLDYPFPLMQRVLNGNKGILGNGIYSPQAHTEMLYQVA